MSREHATGQHFLVHFCLRPKIFCDKLHKMGQFLRSVLCFAVSVENVHLRLDSLPQTQACERHALPSSVPSSLALS